MIAVRCTLLIGLLALAGCDGADGATDGMSDAMADATSDAIADATADAAPPAPGEVRYVLDWDDTGLDVAADGTWSVTNDLGHRVHITRGWLTSYNVSLVPCWLIEGTERAARRDGPLDALGRALWALLGGVAHAGHDDEPDPSLYATPHVEPLVGRAPLALPPVTGVPAETYCKVFYLVARADADAVGAPAEVPFDRVTLHLEGTWRPPGGEPAPFALVTDLNIGRNLGLYAPGTADAEGADLRLDPAESGLTVTIHRRPAGWFDGLDFAATTDDTRRARALMPNLVAALWTEVR